MKHYIDVSLTKDNLQRVLNGLYLLKQSTTNQIDDCKDKDQENVAWLEWSYISELIYELECKYHFDIDSYGNVC